MGYSELFDILAVSEKEGHMVLCLISKETLNKDVLDEYKKYKSIEIDL